MYCNTWSKEQQIERDGGHQIDDEPAPEVVDSDLGRRAHHLVVLTHIGGAKVYQNVNDEHNVDYQVNNNWKMEKKQMSVKCNAMMCSMPNKLLKIMMYVHC